MGLVVHSLLLVPYYSWKHSHRRHHSNTGSLAKDEVRGQPFAALGTGVTAYLPCCLYACRYHPNVGPLAHGRDKVCGQLCLESVTRLNPSSQLCLIAAPAFCQWLLQVFVPTIREEVSNGFEWGQLFPLR